MRGGVFLSAIKGSDGEVDAGYLALFWVMAATVGAVPVIVVLAGVSALVSPADAAATLQGAGVAVGAICTGCAAVIGAVGLFRAGDKDRPDTRTVSASQSTTTTTS